MIWFTLQVLGEKTIERNKNHIEVVLPPEEKNSAEKSASSTEQLPNHYNNDKLKSSPESLSKVEENKEHPK